MNEQNITITNTITQTCDMHRDIIIRCIEDIYQARADMEYEENLRGVLQSGCIPHRVSISLDSKKINAHTIALRHKIKETVATRIASEQHLKNLKRAQRAVTLMNTVLVRGI